MYKNCVKHILYISEILNFYGEHSNMHIYKTLEKNWILKILRKESIFLYSLRHDLQFSTYWDVYFFSWFQFPGLLYVTVHRYLLKRQQFTKMVWLTLFLFSLNQLNVKSEKNCDMKKCLILCDVCHSTR